MIIVIAGPTGVGKTKLSVEIAKKLNGEIINADSTQIFKGLDIATAKVTKEEMQGIKHHLIDIKDISEDYTVYDYQKDGRIIIDDIIKRDRIPIIVGGTGLYIKALLYDYKFEGYSKEEYKDYSTLELYNKLKSIDPDSSIHPNNRKRIVRALNYYLDTHKKYSSKEITDKILYDKVLFIGLTTNRDNLYNIINKRVDVMLDNGLEEEARNIYDTNIRTKAVMTPIGYKELFEYFDHEISKEDAIELIKRNSRRYAKRQYTWFNNKMQMQWFEVDYNNFNNTIKEVINYVQKNS